MISQVVRRTTLHPDRIEMQIDTGRLLAWLDCGEADIGPTGRAADTRVDAQHSSFVLISTPITVRGPMTKEDKVVWDELRRRKGEFKAELSELNQMLIDDPDCSYRHIIEDDIAHATKMIEMISRLITD